MTGIGRVAVVTGGGSGIGRAICEHLAGRGDRVAVLDVDERAAQVTVEGLQRRGVRALGCGVDVACREQVERAFVHVRSELGAVEILVTCAGITRWEPFEDMPVDSWNEVLTVNVTGTFHCVQVAIPDMVSRGWGRVVTLTSASFQAPTPHHAHYIASKGAVIGLTRALAVEYASNGITVNAIAPHIIDTPMMRAGLVGSGRSLEDLHARIPVGRLGTGGDVAAACLFLCSDDAGYLTGQVVGVNGGALS